MEQQVTVPVETGLFGIPHLEEVRSISIFGLSDVKLYFDYGSDYFKDRQEALNRLQLITLPMNLSPQLSPESPIGEIYRYQVTGRGLFAERAESDAELGHYARDQAGVRNSRRGDFRRHHAPISGGSGPRTVCCNTTSRFRRCSRRSPPATRMPAAII